MKPYYADEQVTLHLGDCLKVLADLPDASVDAVVTDPPAGVHFMGRDWDSDRGGRDRWIEWLGDRMGEAYRVLKPGGHALVWALPRTSHWTAMALEDAGFQIRDCVLHLFGGGFPKSLDVSKAIDRRRVDEIGHVCEFLRLAIDASALSRREIGKHFGLDPRGVDLWAPKPTDSAAIQRARVPTWEQWVALRSLLGFGDGMDAEVQRLNGRKGTPGNARPDRIVSDPAGRTVYQPLQNVVSAGTPVLEDAARWSGWGTSLKPGQEIWWLVRKPMTGTVAANVLEYGTGALNIDATRVGDDTSRGDRYRGKAPGGGHGPVDVGGLREQPWEVPVGRWPSNVVFTHSASCVEDGPCADGCPVADLDAQSGVRTSGSRKAGTYGLMGYMGADAASMPAIEGDSGGASRFFPVFRYEAKAPTSERPRLADGTSWPTVKPLGLMRWLIRLITPPGGLVLDCFAGSGATAEAAVIEGFRCLLIERDLDAAELIKARLSKPIQPTLGDIA